MIIVFIFITAVFFYQLYIVKRFEVRQLSLIRSDFLKAIFPFLIILHHISFKYANPIIMDFRYLGPYVVGIFFFMSGYGLEHKALQGSLRCAQIGKRLKTLFIPLLFPIILYGIVVWKTLSDPLEFVLSSFKEVNLFLPFTWFVIVLAVLYVLYYLLRPIIKKVLIFDILMFCALVILMLLLYFKGYSGTLFVSNFAFLLGIIYRQNEKKILLGNIKWMRIVALAIICFISISYIKDGEPLFHGFALVAVTPYVLAFFLIYATFTVNEKDLKENSVFQFLQGISYQLYLCHGIAFLMIDQVKFDSCLLYTASTFLILIPMAWISKIFTNKIMLLI